MGNRRSKHLKAQQMKEAMDSTHFSEQEIKELYRSFKKDYPKGVINKSQFIKRYCQLLPAGDGENMAKEIFRCSDADGNGVLSFKEFMEMTSVLSRGTLTEKLNWSFYRFDKDGDGAVTKEEFINMLKVAYTMTGKTNYETIEQETEEIFQALDTNNDRLISFEEFMNREVFLEDEDSRYKFICFIKNVLPR